MNPCILRIPVVKVVARNLSRPSAAVFGVLTGDRSDPSPKRVIGPEWSIEASDMSRSSSLSPFALFVVASLATTGLTATALVASSVGARAQIGTIFSDPPPRPPGSIPGGHPVPEYDDEEAPELPPQGRLLPAPNQRRGIGVPPPGAFQSQPLPPPPGTTVVPRTAPETATAPAARPAPQAQPPAGPADAKAAPPSPATLQPGDEIVTAPPSEKIRNKKAVFAGLDKITGRIISFDTDIGETVQFGALRVKTDACYTRPATEAANTDAFVEVEEITLQGEVKRIFSGWMFAASPGLHGVEHPVYDVWLTDCKMPEATVAATQAEAQPKAAQPAPPPLQQKRAAPQRQPAQPRYQPLPPFQQ